MSVRFLADEDIDVAIIQAVRSCEHAIDILDVKIAGLRGVKDLRCSNGRSRRIEF